MSYDFLSQGREGFLRLYRRPVGSLLSNVLMLIIFLQSMAVTAMEEYHSDQCPYYLMQYDQYASSAIGKAEQLIAGLKLDELSVLLEEMEVDIEVYWGQSKYCFGHREKLTANPQMSEEFKLFPLHVSRLSSYTKVSQKILPKARHSDSELNKITTMLQW